MRILVAYDGSISADAAIEDLGRAGLPAQAEALVVCVADKGLVPPHPADRKEIQDDPEESSRSKLAEAEVLAGNASERLRSHFPQWTVSSEVLWGSPAKIILETIARWHPQLVAVGSHGRSVVARLFLVCNLGLMEMPAAVPSSPRIRGPAANPPSIPNSFRQRSSDGPACRLLSRLHRPRAIPRN